jgi:membrane protease YdiL (CAAX protease family)
MDGQDTVARPRGALIAWLVFVGIFAALNYAAQLSGTETPDDLAYRYSSSIVAFVQYWVILGIVMAIALISRVELRSAFAIRRPTSWPRAIGVAILALFAIYLAAFVYERLLSLFGDWNPTDEQGLVPDGWDSSRAGAFVAFFLVVTLVAPAVEELTYRGLGLSLLVPYGVPFAILVTGVLFGAAHGLLVALPVLAIFGIVVGWLRVRTNSIYPPMLLHATFNATALLVSVSGAG